MPGSNGTKMQLLVVRTAAGTPQEMGTTVTAETKRMKIPGVRESGPPGGHYSSVRVRVPHPHAASLAP